MGEGAAAAGCSADGRLEVVAAVAAAAAAVAVAAVAAGGCLACKRLGASGGVGPPGGARLGDAAVPGDEPGGDSRAGLAAAFDLVSVRVGGQGRGQGSGQGQDRVSVLAGLVAGSRSTGGARLPAAALALGGGGGVPLRPPTALLGMGLAGLAGAAATSRDIQLSKLDLAPPRGVIFVHPQS